MSSRVDMSRFRRGDVIEVARMEYMFGVNRNHSAFRPAMLDLRQRLENELGIVSRCVRGALTLLHAHEHEGYGVQQAELSVRRIGRNAKRLQRTPLDTLSESERSGVESAAARLAAATRVGALALRVGKRTRSLAVPLAEAAE